MNKIVTRQIVNPDRLEEGYHLYLTLESVAGFNAKITSCQLRRDDSNEIILKDMQDYLTDKAKEDLEWLALIGLL
jgi:hypothetical protein